MFTCYACGNEVHASALPSTTEARYCAACAAFMRRELASFEAEALSATEAAQRAIRSLSQLAS